MTINEYDVALDSEISDDDIIERVLANPSADKRPERKQKIGDLVKPIQAILGDHEARIEDIEQNGGGGGGVIGSVDTDEVENKSTVAGANATEAFDDLGTRVSALETYNTDYGVGIPPEFYTNPPYNFQFTHIDEGATTDTVVLSNIANNSSVLTITVVVNTTSSTGNLKIDLTNAADKELVYLNLNVNMYCEDKSQTTSALINFIVGDEYLSKCVANAANSDLYNSNTFIMKGWFQVDKTGNRLLAYGAGGTGGASDTDNVTNLSTAPGANATEAFDNHEARIATIEGMPIDTTAKDTEQDFRLNSHEAQIVDLEERTSTKDTEHDLRLDSHTAQLVDLEERTSTKDLEQDFTLASHTAQLLALETRDDGQDLRLDSIEQVNEDQNEAIAVLEKRVTSDVPQEFYINPPYSFTYNTLNAQTLDFNVSTLVNKSSYITWNAKNDGSGYKAARLNCVLDLPDQEYIYMDFFLTMNGSIDTADANGYAEIRMDFFIGGQQVASLSPHEALDGTTNLTDSYIYNMKGWYKVDRTENKLLAIGVNPTTLGIPGAFYNNSPYVLELSASGTYDIMLSELINRRAKIATTNELNITDALNVVIKIKDDPSVVDGQVVYLDLTGWIDLGFNAGVSGTVTSTMLGSEHLFYRQKKAQYAETESATGNFSKCGYFIIDKANDRLLATASAAGGAAIGSPPPEFFTNPTFTFSDTAVDETKYFVIPLYSVANRQAKLTLVTNNATAEHKTGYIRIDLAAAQDKELVYLNMEVYLAANDLSSGTYTQTQSVLLLGDEMYFISHALYTPSVLESESACMVKGWFQVDKIGNRLLSVAGSGNESNVKSDTDSVTNLSTAPGLNVTEALDGHEVRIGNVESLNSGLGVGVPPEYFTNTPYSFSETATIAYNKNILLDEIANREATLAADRVFASGSFRYEIDIENSSYNDGDLVYLDYRWYFNVSNSTTTANVSMYMVVGRQTLDFFVTNMDSDAGTSGYLKGWYQVDKTNDRLLAYNGITGLGTGIPPEFFTNPYYDNIITHIDETLTDNIPLADVANRDANITITNETTTAGASSNATSTLRIDLNNANDGDLVYMNLTVVMHANDKSQVAGGGNTSQVDFFVGGELLGRALCRVHPNLSTAYTDEFNSNVCYIKGWFQVDKPGNRLLSYTGVPAATNATTTWDEPRIVAIEDKNTEQDNRLDTIEIDNGDQITRIIALETENTTQNNTLATLEGEVDTNKVLIDGLGNKVMDDHEPRIAALEASSGGWDENRILAIESKNTSQDFNINSQSSQLVSLESNIMPRLDTIEAKNTEQDNRLSSIDASIAANNFADRSQAAQLASLNDRLSTTVAKNDEQDTKLATIEPAVADHETRIDALEAGGGGTWDEIRVAAIEDKNIEQDFRLDSHDAQLVSLEARLDAIENPPVLPTDTIGSPPDEFYVNTPYNFTDSSVIPGTVNIPLSDISNRPSEISFTGSNGALVDDAKVFDIIIDLTPSLDKDLVYLNLKYSLISTISSSVSNTLLSFDTRLFIGGEIVASAYKKMVEINYSNDSEVEVGTIKGWFMVDKPGNRLLSVAGVDLSARYFAIGEPPSEFFSNAPYSFSQLNTTEEHYIVPLSSLANRPSTITFEEQATDAGLVVNGDYTIDLTAEVDGSLVYMNLVYELKASSNFTVGQSYITSAASLFIGGELIEKSNLEDIGSANGVMTRSKIGTIKGWYKVDKTNNRLLSVGCIKTDGTSSIQGDPPSEFFTNPLFELTQNLVSSGNVTIQLDDIANRESNVFITSTVSSLDLNNEIILELTGYNDKDVVYLNMKYYLETTIPQGAATQREASLQLRLGGELSAYVASAATTSAGDTTKCDSGIIKGWFQVDTPGNRLLSIATGASSLVAKNYDSNKIKIDINDVKNKVSTITSTADFKNYLIDVDLSKCRNGERVYLHIEWVITNKDSFFYCIENFGPGAMGCVPPRSFNYKIPIAYGWYKVVLNRLIKE